MCYNYNMKKIPLTQGKFALVDDEDYERLNQHKWSASKHYNTYYAGRNTGKRPNRGHIYMHRQILGLTKGDGKITDHFNDNGLNNQKANLRIVTNSENAYRAKTRKAINKTSKYKGVCWHKVPQKWVASIKYNGHLIYLGIFNTEIKAAKAYDVKAKELFGEFARFNFV